MMRSGSPSEPSPAIEAITHQGSLLAYVIRRDASSDTTQFITSGESSFQAGFVVYPDGARVQAHVHLPVTRQVVGTSELLLVRSGRCIMDVYSHDCHLVASRELEAGDAVLSLAGGHGFRMIEHTVLLEVKQGPYVGPGEKERFATTTDGEPL